MSDAKTEVVDLVDLDDEGKQPPKYHQVAENCYEILDTDDDEDGEDDDRKMPAVATKKRSSPTSVSEAGELFEESKKKKMTAPFSTGMSANDSEVQTVVPENPAL